MPEPGTLLLFAAAALVLIAVPGPNVLYIAARSMADGRRAGLVSVLGVETGTLLHVAAAAVGLSALLASSAVAFAIVKYAGAAYLIVLGVRALLADDPPSQTSRPPSVSLGRAYRQGIVVQVLNPKVALFFLALLPQFLDPGRGALAPQVLVLGSIVVVIGISISSLYAVAAGALGERLRGHGAIARPQRYVTGATYLALGAAAALSGQRSGS